MSCGVGGKSKMDPWKRYLSWFPNDEMKSMEQQRQIRGSQWEQQHEASMEVWMGKVYMNKRHMIFITGTHKVCEEVAVDGTEVGTSWIRKKNIRHSVVFNTGHSSESQMLKPLWD